MDVLSYAGTLCNRERLMDQAFLPLGTCMHDSDMDLLERCFTAGLGPLKHWIETALLEFASRYMPEEPPE